MFETQVQENLHAVQQAYAWKMTCVTEALLPKSSLQRLISSFKNEKQLSIEWYCQSLKVAHMFKDQISLLVCKVEVPMIAKEQYVRFKVHTYPVAIPMVWICLNVS